MKNKIFRFLWVIILVICAFALGYTLKPEGNRRPPMFSKGSSSSNGLKAPPLNFQRQK